jgi:hypothetical protein
MRFRSRWVQGLGFKVLSGLTSASLIKGMASDVNMSEPACPFVA